MFSLPYKRSTIKPRSRLEPSSSSNLPYMTRFPSLPQIPQDSLQATDPLDGQFRFLVSGGEVAVRGQGQPALRIEECYLG